MELEQVIKAIEYLTAINSGLIKEIELLKAKIRAVETQAIMVYERKVVVEERKLAMFRL